MPTLAEFILTISLRYDKEENYTSTLFQFETAQQFRLFRYKIEIEDVVDPETKRFSFEIKGIHISSTTMSGTGPAKKEKSILTSGGRIPYPCSTCKTECVVYVDRCIE
ncbi:MAG: hypothetical protein J4G05_04885 [Chlorobi bacterium]|nr:hypothetical protein [Chlorobiota bacterium]